MSTPTRAQTIGAGLALILLPLLAIALKLMVFPGWMMLIIFFSAIPLLVGYALQIVVAANGMFRARGVFNLMPGARRGLIAAWLTSGGVFLAAFFLVDGGDDGTYGSAFTELLGTSSTAAGGELSGVLMTISAFVWIAAWVWLVVEWVVQLTRARRAAEPRAAAAGAEPRS